MHALVNIAHIDISTAYNSFFFAIWLQHDYIVIYMQCSNLRIPLRVLGENQEAC